MSFADVGNGIDSLTCGVFAAHLQTLGEGRRTRNRRFGEHIGTRPNYGEGHRTAEVATQVNRRRYVSGKDRLGTASPFSRYVRETNRAQSRLLCYYTKVIEHQRLNGIIEELRTANAVEDAKIAHLGANLRETESVLQNALDEARPRVAALKRANKRPVDVDEVISYGSKISASMSAPAGWDPSQPLGNHLPPAPTEDMMRSGKLAAMSFEEQEKAEKAAAGS